MSVNSVHVIDELVKQGRPGYMEPTINIKAYPPDRRICAYTVYKGYMFRTKTLRKNHSKFLISYVKPYLPVTRDTISRWTKTVLARAKINTSISKAHSVRSASVSKAKENLMSVSKILSKAGWSNSKTSARFYDKKIEKDEDSFTYHVLKNTKYLQFKVGFNSDIYFALIFIIYLSFYHYCFKVSFDPGSAYNEIKLENQTRLTLISRCLMNILGVV